MKGKNGVVFSISDDNAPVPGCTVSETVYENGETYIAHFSLAPDTDISAEIYGCGKLIFMLGGALEVCADKTCVLRCGDAVLTRTDVPIGMRSPKTEGAIYTELSVKGDDIVNEAIKTGEVFRLAKLVPYREGKIVNMDIVRSEKMKFVVMSFDEGTGLSEHAAPGEALIFALEGKGIIGYEGKEHHIKAGENFKFAKRGKHWVKADGRFKMALLMTLE